MPTAKRISQRRKRIQGGSVMVEFALCMAFLAPILAGTFSTGASLAKAIQAGEVCRDANVLVVRGINLALSDNQQLVVRTAQGLSMNLTGSNSPDPNGKGVIILTRVYRVSGNDCLAQGLQATSSSCPNLDNYVITNRIIIGNSSLFTSVTGTPASPLDANGNIAASQYVVNTGDRASDFPSASIMSAGQATSGLLYLDPGGYTYVSEATFDISALNLFSILKTPILYARNLS